MSWYSSPVSKDMESLYVRRLKVYLILGYTLSTGVQTYIKERGYERLLRQYNNNIIVGSYGTMSTGVNIKNLHHVIFASPSKSRVRVLQSIGRGLRKAKGKSDVYVV